MTAIIDILLATYNGANYLAQQIDSIINQSHSNWRIIARDDGSTDQTVSILQRYNRLLGDRFILLDDSEGNLGPANNFCRLLAHCSAPYLMFCDQDDVWFPNKIEITLAAMQAAEYRGGQNMPMLAHTDLTVTDSLLNPLANSFWRYQNIDPSRDSFHHFMVQNVVTGCSMMINRATLRYITVMPATAIMHDWWIALICAAFGRIVYINQPTLYYRQHGLNDTGAKQWNISFIVEKLERLSCQKSIMAKQKQAEAFFVLYQDQLDPKGQILIQAFVATHKIPWLRRCHQLFKHRIFMHGVIRNLGLYLNI